LLEFGLFLVAVISSTYLHNNFGPIIHAHTYLLDANICKESAKNYNIPTGVTQAFNILDYYLIFYHLNMCTATYMYLMPC